MTLGELRRQVYVERVTLDRLKAELVVTKADAERRVIEAAEAEGRSMGKNADERERNLILALAYDNLYRTSSAIVHDRRVQLADLEATYEAALDQRRDNELQVRKQLIERLPVVVAVDATVAAAQDDMF